MKKLIFSITCILSLNVFASGFEFNQEPSIAVGIRAGTKEDMNNNPSVYAGLKMSVLKYESTHTVKFLVPGIGVQSSSGKAYINLSVAPIVFEGNNGFGFGVDIFSNTKNAVGGTGNLGFFLQKSF